MSDHNNGRTDTIIHDAPKPRCETCPAWESERDGNYGWCHEGAQRMTEERNVRSWYCNRHPGYPAWAAQEYQRRLAVKKGGG